MPVLMSAGMIFFLQKFKNIYLRKTDKVQWGVLHSCKSCQDVKRLQVSFDRVTLCAIPQPASFLQIIDCQETAILQKFAFF